MLAIILEGQKMQFKTPAPVFNKALIFLARISGSSIPCKKLQKKIRQ